MKYSLSEKLIYKCVSLFIVFPVFRLIFRGSLSGLENIPRKDSFIIVANHGSLLDPPFLGHALGLRVSFMAKEELFRVPIIGLIIRACGAYPVKRGIADRNSINLAIEKLSTKNVIGIFIDGTRQKNGRVNKPKNGASLIAAKTHKKLLPVAIINSHRLVKFKYFIPIFNKVIIKIGKPIDFPKITNKENISLTTNLITNQINKLLG